jgi:hypothetical protein
MRYTAQPRIHAPQQEAYSIASSALARIVWGRTTPISWAALMLTEVNPRDFSDRHVFLHQTGPIFDERFEFSTI